MRSQARWILIPLFLTGMVRANFEYAPLAGRGDTAVALGSGILGLGFNPATIGPMYYWEAVGMYQQPNWLNLHQFALAVGGNLGGGIAFGAMANGEIYDDRELGVSRVNAVVGLAKGLYAGGYGGLALRGHFINTTLDQQQVQGEVSLGVDLGFMHKGLAFFKDERLVHAFAPFTFGFALRDVMLFKGDGTNQTGAGFSLDGWRMGFSYTFFNLLSLAFDLGGENVSTGLELTLTPALFLPPGTRNRSDLETALVLRFGLLRPRNIPDLAALGPDLGALFGGAFSLGQGDGGRPLVTFGAGVSVNQFDLSYAGILDNSLSLDHRFSFGYRFGYEDSYVQPLEVNLKNLFSALSKSYSRNPVGTVKLKNTSAQVLTVDLGYFVKGLMDAPTYEPVVLRPKSEKVVDVHAVFNEAITGWKSEKPVQGQIYVRYRFQNKNIEKRVSKNFILYDRNSITWDIPEQVMVFVTPKDPVVMEFSRRALEIMGTNQAPFLPQGLAKAMAIFDAVTAWGMTYVHSASGAFASDTSTKSVIDSVQYPRETLKLHAGKCGDTTVLFCSLLESVGIKTAFVDIPGHVFMMFDTEVPEAAANSVSPDPEDYVVRDGTVWIAVETTIWKDGFVAAWKEGMLEYWKWVKK